PAGAHLTGAELDFGEDLAAVTGRRQEGLDDLLEPVDRSGGRAVASALTGDLEGPAAEDGPRAGVRRRLLDQFLEDRPFTARKLRILRGLPEDVDPFLDLHARHSNRVGNGGWKARDSDPVTASSVAWPLPP